MPESQDPETAIRVAKLARIHLSEEDAAETQRQLSKILDYVGQLNEADVPDGTQPFFGAAEAVNAIRDDEVKESFDREAILKNAPDTDGDFYRVPPVFK